MKFYRRRKNQLCTWVLVTCILFSFSLLASHDSRGHLFLSQYLFTNVGRSLLKRSSSVSSDRRAINHPKPLIDFDVTVPPVLDESGYFVGKVLVDTEQEQGGQRLPQDGALVHTRREDNVVRNPNGSRTNLKKTELGVKGTWQSTMPKSAEDLIDILDSKISQIPQVVDQAREFVDVDLADEFLQIHKALKPAPKKDNPVRVLIVTNRRSGSSFLGQILNQNPGIFFNFEPLKLLEQKPGIYANQSVFLSLLLSCKFKQMPFLMDFYNKERLHRSGSLAFSSPPLCTLSVPVNSTNVRQCDKLHPTFAASVCARYSHTAAKLIRLYDISSLERLVTRNNLNLKIIHLVRDPRGILSSRSAAEKRTLNVDKGLEGEAGYLCRRIKSNLGLASSRPPWLEGRYMLVRYEDIAYDPEKWANQVYKFAGLGTVPSEVLSWIRTNTNVESTNVYSTSRNSKATAEAWRKAISFPVAKRIGEVCKDVLSLLKYQPLENKEELINMKRSVVNPW